MSIGVRTDIAQLHKVIMHRPDAGIEQVSPSNFEQLLYDDVVYLDDMQREHDLFTSTIKALAGPETVIEVQDLLADILQDTDLRQELLAVLAHLDKAIGHHLLRLRELEAHTLAATLITGQVAAGQEPLFKPVPNFIYTRDTGVMINDYVLSCQHRRQARKRESVFTWFITHYHPLFKGKVKGYIDLSANVQALKDFVEGEESPSIEGGDVMLLTSEHLLLTWSDRSRKETARAVIAQLFEQGVVKRCTLVKIPAEHTYMHVDTVFTAINHADFVAMESVMLNPARTQVWHYEGSLEAETVYPTIKECLQEQLGDIRIIPCGGGDFVAADREQWTAGCNFTALKPGVVFAYDRNKRTKEALLRAGYQEMLAADVLRQAQAGDLSLQNLENTIISIPSAELARGGGGPHCLTFPISRG